MLYCVLPASAPPAPPPWFSSKGAQAAVGPKPWPVKPNPRLKPSPPQPKFKPCRKQDSGEGGSLDEDDSKNNKSLSECYFAGKGAAVVLAPHDRPPPASIHPQPRPPDIQHHLQSMFYLLRQEETLKMAVKLESVHSGRTRYLVVVSRLGKQMTEESCLLGIDCNHTTTVGLVLKVLADTSITLDGDGGFSVSVAGRTHIFKPVSVQAMWSALQTLHKVSGKARAHNYFLHGVSHEWVGHYEKNIASDRSCLNEWHAMDSIESRRPPSPDSIRHKPVEREETKSLIRSSLKEIMMSVDLDEVTSKQVRARLEESLDVDLAEYKPFIDEEMLVILGQMDEATEIFPHVYLGSEWNASNLEELSKNGVCHILNVTREIDNFFPGMFDYLNIRVYDDEKTDLLKHWDDTFKYITKAKKAGSKVLVHCKMGVSRSASVVIAYAMKAYSWDLKQAITYVQNKRNCIKPNSSFIQQLETYQGILDAMKNREKLIRSKSETNLKCNGENVGSTDVCGDRVENTTCPSEVSRSKSESEARVPPLHSHMPPPAPPLPILIPPHRPKSWSPDHATANNIFTNTNANPWGMRRHFRISRSARFRKGNSTGSEEVSVPPPPPLPPPPTPPIRSIGVCVRKTCSNGLAYSVSQNKILHLPTVTSGEDGVVKSRVEELEAGRRNDRKGMVLNLTSHFEEDRFNVNTRNLQQKEIITQKENVDMSQRDSQPKEIISLWESQLKEPFILKDPPVHKNALSVQDNSLRVVQETIQPMEQDKPVERRDLFSSQLDRVFDKEEGSGSGVSRQSSWGSGDRVSPEPGIVKSLKREFEAKSKSSGNSSGGSSLPSSPVSERSGQPAAPTASLEDLTSKGIVNKHRPPKAPPPPAAVAVATTVVAKAQKKKLQQGKTHPLARLTYKHPRHPNPVYNTM